MAEEVMETGFGDVEPAQVGFEVHDAFVVEEYFGELGARVGAAALDGDVVKVLVELAALGADNGVWVGSARDEGEHELDKEFVALVLAGDGLTIPFAERGFALGRDGVDTLFGSAALFDGVFDDESVFLEARKGGVYLGGLDVPVLFASNDGFKGGMEFVAMTRALGEETENGVTDGHGDWKLEVRRWLLDVSS